MILSRLLISYFCPTAFCGEFQEPHSREYSSVALFSGDQNLIVMLTTASQTIWELHTFWKSSEVEHKQAVTRRRNIIRQKFCVFTINNVFGGGNGLMSCDAMEKVLVMGRRWQNPSGIDSSLSPFFPSFLAAGARHIVYRQTMHISY